MRRFGLLFCAILLIPALVRGQVAPATRPVSEVADLISRIDEQFRRELPVEQLLSLDEAKIEQLLTAEQRHILATRYFTFTVDVPVDVYVMHCELNRTPFWLAEQGFTKTDQRVVLQTRRFPVWHKAFDAGEVGLGLDSFKSDAPRHYFVAILPRHRQANVQVTNLPPRARLDTLTMGKPAQADRTEVVTELPAELDGAVLIRPHGTSMGRWTRLIGRYRATKFPATASPDSLTLTWSGDPRTTQAIQWRTDTSISAGIVEYRPTDAPADQAKRVKATTEAIHDAYTLNNPTVHWHRAILTGLQSDTEYVYRVGSESSDNWSDPRTFRTAPRDPRPFTFVYLGDSQQGLDECGRLLREIHQRHPEARFYIIAGDLVEYGDERDNWDAFFGHLSDVLSQRPLVPVIGNHDVIGGGPRFYLSFFALPDNGPADAPAGRAYSLAYGNAELFVLDSNFDRDIQARWLDQRLPASQATWKLATFHHPPYSGHPVQEALAHRRDWSPVLERHNVSLVMTGHVHHYFRSRPIRDEGLADPPSAGTIYAVAVFGTKLYEAVDKPLGALSRSDTRTYQLITIDGSRLSYRAFDADHQEIDTFTLEKP